MKRLLFSIAALSTALFGAAPDSNESYLLGPDDKVLLRSTQIREIDEKQFSVSKEGTLDLPLAGSVNAGGLAPSELRSRLEAAFGRYYHQPAISVEIVEFGSQPVSVLGSVAKPGVYQLQGRNTLAEVLSLAGGLAPDAGYSVLITRRDEAGAEQTLSYTVSDLMRGEAVGKVDVLPHDVITVPRAALIYVLGDVRKPGGFTLADEERASVLQALAMAEGALPTASLKNCTILKSAAGGGERLRVAVNLRRLIDGKTEDMLLEAGDVLVVPSSAFRKASVKVIETALQTASGIVIWRRPI